VIYGVEAIVIDQLLVGAAVESDPLLVVDPPRVSSDWHLFALRT